MIEKLALASVLAASFLAVNVKPAEAQWWRVLGYVGAGWVGSNVWNYGAGPIPPHLGYGYTWGRPRGYGGDDGFGPPRRYGYYGPPRRYYYGGW